jgi:hypothetical protein
MVVIYNSVLGNLGLGVFISPVISFRNIRRSHMIGAISGGEAAMWSILSFWPYAALAALVAWSLWLAVAF